MEKNEAGREDNVAGDILMQKVTVSKALREVRERTMCKGPAGDRPVCLGSMREVSGSGD